MPYPAISSRRMPYDVDGTVAGWNKTNSAANGITDWVTNPQIVNLNNEDYNTTALGYSASQFNAVCWFFFSEEREIEQIALALYSATTLFNIQGSNDTSNGVDGTWETASMPSGNPSATNFDGWRTNVKPVSFSTSYKTIRITCRDTSSGSVGRGIRFLHIYGRKAAGETSDDILMCDTNGNELTALLDWGDRPEGTTLIKSFKVKNASTTKIANNVNLQLNHADFLMSLDQVNWAATIDIASIPANNLSAEIFVKNTLGPPLLVLGPTAARIIATVGSFT